MERRKNAFATNPIIHLNSCLKNKSFFLLCDRQHVARRNHKGYRIMPELSN